MIFRKSWPRFAMESKIEYEIQQTGLSGGRCINVGCGTSGRYKELLSSFETDGVDILEPGNRKMPWRYHQVDAAKLPFQDFVFDFAITIESLNILRQTKKQCQNLREF